MKEGLRAICFKCGKYGHKESQCGADPSPSVEKQNSGVTGDTETARQQPAVDSNIGGISVVAQ